MAGLKSIQTRFIGTIISTIHPYACTPIDVDLFVLYYCLDPSCNKYCYLIGQEQVSISLINL